MGEGEEGDDKEDTEDEGGDGWMDGTGEELLNLSC